MPSTTSSVVSIVLDSSTVMTPSLPTFFIASAMIEPICLSLLAEIVPTCAIMSPLTSLWSLLISPTATSTDFSMPRLRAMGLAPAATVFTPSRKMACASTVAVVVPSPATSAVFDATSRTICAPMFSSGSGSSISLATVTPSLVIMGAPNFFSMTALRPFGPSVIFTASASAFTPRRMDWREFSPVTICFAISAYPPKLSPRNFPFSYLKRVRANDLARLKIVLPFAACGLCCTAELCQDFVFFENEKFLIVNFDFVAAVFAKQNPVAGFYVERNPLAFFDSSCPNGDDFALLRLFLGRVGNDDAALHGLFLFQPPNQHAVV